MTDLTTLEAELSAQVAAAPDVAALAQTIQHTIESWLQERDLARAALQGAAKGGQP